MDTPQNEKWLKAAVFDNILTHVIDTEADNPGATFGSKELNVMYVDQLQSKGIKENVNTTCFTKRLVDSIPELHSETVDNKIRLVFRRKVKELVGDYINSPDIVFFAIRRVVGPLRKEIGKQSNTFRGSFSDFTQFTSVPSLRENHFRKLKFHSQFVHLKNRKTFTSADGVDNSKRSI